MAVTSSAYGKFAMHLGSGDIDFATNNFTVMLLKNTYTPNVDTHEFTADAAGGGNEVSTSGTGYAAQALTGVTWTYDATNNRGVMGANPALWSAVTMTFRYAAVYQSDVGYLVSYVDFGADQTYTAEDFQLSFTNGVVRLKLV